MKKNKKIKWLVSLVVLGAILLALLSEVIGPRMLLVPRRVTNTSQFTPEKYGLQGTYITFDTKDNIQLEGYLSQGVDDAKRIILLCHGIGSCKEHQFSVSKFFNALGFDVLTFDSRAHGKSGGEYCTYGAKEKEDVSAIITQLEGKGYTDFYIYGQSLGGGIALQSLAYDTRIKGGIIISTFSSLEEVSFDYQKRLTKIPWQWLNDRVNTNAGKMADFHPKEVAPVISCTQIKQPVFMVHGEKDQRINPNCATRNFAALRSDHKELEMIPEGYHNNAWSVGGKPLTEKMMLFMEMYF